VSRMTINTWLFPQPMGPTTLSEGQKGMKRNLHKMYTMILSSFLLLLKTLPIWVGNIGASHPKKDGPAAVSASGFCWTNSVGKWAGSLCDFKTCARSSSLGTPSCEARTIITLTMIS